MSSLRHLLPDLRDVFVFGGLAALGYGLWLYRPWVAWAVCGALVFLLGMIPAPRARG